jgi:hypothetical protein
MRRIRRHLVAFAAAILTAQLGGIAAASAAICLMAGARSDSDAAIACICAHGPAGECPMHKAKPKPSPGQTRWCAGCSDGTLVVLTTIAGLAGVLSARHVTALPPAIVELIGSSRAAALDRPQLPLSPPPRGESPVLSRG